MNELQKYIEKNPGIKKTWIAEKLGVSKQRISQLLKEEKLSKKTITKIKNNLK